MPKVDAEIKANTFEPHAKASAASRVIVWGSMAIVFYVAHAALIPVALALLLALVLSGPVEALHKRRFPRSLSAALIMIVALCIMGGVAALIWTPAQGWIASAPQTMALIKKKITPLARVMNSLEDFRKSAGALGSSGPAKAAPAPIVAAASESAPEMLLDVGGPAIAGVLTFVIVTLFLLTGGPPMTARMTAAFVNNLKASYVRDMIDKVRAEVGQFYLTTTLINIGLGLATGLAMWAWGMPTPYLWGALAALLNYIPYAGAGATLITVSLVAVVSFDTLGHVLGVAATYVALATMEGQVAQPLLVGRRMEVNPLLIFLGLWFGGLFWGIAGIILATPVLVALKVIAENTRSGAPMMEFLGPNDQTPERDVRLHRIAKRLR